MKKIILLIILSSALYSCKKKEEAPSIKNDCLVSTYLDSRYHYEYDADNRLTRVSDSSNKTLATYEYSLGLVLLKLSSENTISTHCKIYLNTNGTANYQVNISNNPNYFNPDTVFFSYTPDGYLSQCLRKIIIKNGTDTGQSYTHIYRRVFEIENGCIKGFNDTNEGDSIIPVVIVNFEYLSNSPVDKIGFGNFLGLLPTVGYGIYIPGILESPILPHIFGKRNTRLTSKVIRHQSEGGSTDTTSFDYKLTEHKYIASIFLSNEGETDSTYKPVFGYTCK